MYRLSGPLHQQVEDQSCRGVARPGPGRVDLETGADHLQVPAEGQPDLRGDPTLLQGAGAAPAAVPPLPVVPTVPGPRPSEAENLADVFRNIASDLIFFVLFQFVSFPYVITDLEMQC